MNEPDFQPLHPKVVLGVGAHPDDVDFMAGGTLAKFASEGAAVYYLVLTDGSKGTADTSINSETLTKQRRSEQIAAEQAVGAKGTEFLDYPDGQLEITMQLKRDIVKVIRRLKPEVVITFDPSVLYDAKRGFINHPDHRAAAQSTLDAVFPLARDHLSFPELFQEGYEPHKVKTVLLNNFSESNFFIDITSTMDQKIAALAAHKSQMGDIEQVEAMVRQWASASGAHAGLPYAESFMRIDTMA